MGFINQLRTGGHHPVNLPFGDRPPIFLRSLVRSQSVRRSSPKFACLSPVCLVKKAILIVKSPTYHVFVSMKTSILLWKSPSFWPGKSTISTGPCSIAMWNYQRVYSNDSCNDPTLVNDPTYGGVPKVSIKMGYGWSIISGSVAPWRRQVQRCNAETSRVCPERWIVCLGFEWPWPWLVNGL